MVQKRNICQLLPCTPFPSALKLDDKAFDSQDDLDIGNNLREKMFNSYT